MAVMTSLAVACAWSALAFDDVQKRVLNTEWWPPGTENTTEAIGILSHGLVFMTAMMELEDTLPASVKLEVSDVSDIARAGNVTLQDLVDCYLHARPGTGRAVRKAFVDALPSDANPALTVIETFGEYDWANNSATCIAARPSSAGLHDGLVFADNGAVAADGLLFMPGISVDVDGGIEAELSAALVQVESTAAGASHLLDCTVFVRDSEDLAKARGVLDGHFPADVTPAISLVQVGLEDHARAVTLKCIAALQTTEVSRTEDTAATPQYVFASGLMGNFTNGTDAMAAVGAVLAPTGTGLSDVVNCVFFVSKLEYMNDFFMGFYSTFNVAHFPPPSRGEFVGGPDCDNCTILVKCIAARSSAGALSLV